jgi:hypothetical protein
MQVFPSSKSIYHIILLWAAAILILLPFVLINDGMPLAIALPLEIILFLLLAGLLWMRCDCKYILKDKMLYYRCGPFRGKITIDSIRKIERDNKLMKSVSSKPALGSKGVVIYYNTFDYIFFSPEDIRGFIAALRRINPEIQVK